MDFHNWDTETIVTPVRTDILKSLLKQANYPVDKINYLTDGFRNGFSLGYQGDERVKLRARDPKLRVGDNIDLWNKVMKEVKLKCFAGPFDELLFEFYIQSPLGLVPKDGNKDMRLIFHLSHPRNAKGKMQNGKLVKLVNACIPEHLKKTQYPDFFDVIELCIKEGRCCHIGHSDFRAAFRNLGISRLHWRYLVMVVISPLDGKLKYFFDKCLPFGAAISYYHFQNVSDAIAFLVSFRTKKPLINYLDDFLFAALWRAICNGQIKIFLDICDSINFLIAEDKTSWGTTQLQFLGFLIDTIRQLILIPTDKVAKGLNMIIYIIDKNKKMTILQLQKICGFLNFLGRAMIPGRVLQGDCILILNIDLNLITILKF